MDDKKRLELVNGFKSKVCGGCGGNCCKGPVQILMKGNDALWPLLGMESNPEIRKNVFIHIAGLKPGVISPKEIAVLKTSRHVTIL